VHVPIGANIVPNVPPIVPAPIPMDANIIPNVHPILAINEPIPWPTPGENAIDEYNTPYFFSLMNPYLLPFGTGDCTDKIRLYDVTLHESAGAKVAMPSSKVAVLLSVMFQLIYIQLIVHYCMYKFD
jgi:hypothetical protein